jgi:hypothetical protein
VHHAFRTYRAPPPYPLLALYPEHPPSYFSQNPTNPTMAGVSGMSKVFVVVTF